MTESFEYRTICLEDPFALWRIPVGIVWRHGVGSEIHVLKAPTLPTTYPDEKGVLFIRAFHSRLKWDCRFYERPDWMGPYAEISKAERIAHWEGTSPGAWLMKAMFRVGR